MLQKLSRSAQKTLEKQQNEAMQHYLDYLKSDEGPLNEEKKIPDQPSVREWRVSPVMYPPFED